jgi:hypothetical protein
MALWLIRRTDKVWYDEHDAVVVRAESEQKAREFAMQQDRLYHAGAFGTPERSTCVRVSEDGPDEVVLDSFVAG